MRNPGRLLVAGSIARDTLDTPAGPIHEELGGSALYFALAASLIVPVQIVAPCGREDETRVRELLAGRPVDVTCMDVLDAPTYRWTAHQVDGRNIDLGSRDPIYDIWRPRVPPGYRGWAFVGTVRPDRQLEIIDALSGAELLAADSMVSYINARPTQALEVVRGADWYFCNRDEFTALGGREPEAFRRQWSLRGLVLKAGREGVSAFTPDQVVQVPALSSHPVIDTTGAGDAVAAGMLARWLVTGAAPNGFVDALAWGVACASLTIEGMGLRAIAAATREKLEERVGEVQEQMRRAS